MNGTPALRWRLVGGALRRYREDMDYRLEDAANVLDCDRSKISRIETGKRGIRRIELRELLAEYGTDDRAQAVLCALANPMRLSGWWDQYPDVVRGEHRDMMIMESLTAHVFAYHAQQIPALLQTGEYAAAITGADPSMPAPGTRQRTVEALLARQEAILGAVAEPGLSVIIGEGALRQQVGGPDVMHAQLTRLAAQCDSDSGVTVRVLPFDSTHPVFDGGGLTILTLAPPVLGIVHVAAFSGSFYLADRDDVACYAAAFGRIREASLSASDSATMLRRLAAGEPGSDKAA